MVTPVRRTRRVRWRGLLGGIHLRDVSHPWLRFENMGLPEQWFMEGVSEQQWVLVDLGDVVVHVFSDEIRAYYEIERLYRDVPKVDWRTDA